MLLDFLFHAIENFSSQVIFIIRLRYSIFNALTIFNLHYNLARELLTFLDYSTAFKIYNFIFAEAYYGRCNDYIIGRIAETQKAVTTTITTFRSA